MSNFWPHSYCLLSNWHLIAVDVASDALIAASYLTIAWSLFFVARRPERLAIFLAFIASSGAWILRQFAASFGSFILACACTHIVNIWTMWQAVYYVDAVARVICAVLSVRTAIAVIRLVAHFLAQEMKRA